MRYSRAKTLDVSLFRDGAIAGLLACIDSYSSYQSYFNQRINLEIESFQNFNCLMHQHFGHWGACTLHVILSFFSPARTRIALCQSSMAMDSLRRDVLVLVFREVASSSRVSLGRLARVCRRWRDVVASEREALFERLFLSLGSLYVAGSGVEMTFERRCRRGKRVASLRGAMAMHDEAMQKKEAKRGTFFWSTREASHVVDDSPARSKDIAFPRRLSAAEQMLEDDGGEVVFLPAGLDIYGVSLNAEERPRAGMHFVAADNNFDNLECVLSDDDIAIEFQPAENLDAPLHVCNCVFHLDSDVQSSPHQVGVQIYNENHHNVHEILISDCAFDAIGSGVRIGGDYPIPLRIENCRMTQMAELGISSSCLGNVLTIDNVTCHGKYGLLAAVRSNRCEVTNCHAISSVASDNLGASTSFSFSGCALVSLKHSSARDAIYGICVSTCAKVFLEDVQAFHCAWTGLEGRHDPDEYPSTGFDCTYISSRNLQIQGGCVGVIILEPQVHVQAEGLRILGTIGKGCLNHGKLSMRDSTLSGVGAGITNFGCLGDLENVNVQASKWGDLVMTPRSRFEGNLSNFSGCVWLEHEDESVPPLNLEAQFCNFGASTKRVLVPPRFYREDFASDAEFLSMVISDCRRNARCSNFHLGWRFYPIDHYSCFSCKFTEDTGNGLCAACRQEHADRGCDVGRSREEPVEPYSCGCDCAFAGSHK